MSSMNKTYTEDYLVYLYPLMGIDSTDFLKIVFILHHDANKPILITLIKTLITSSSNQIRKKNKINKTLIDLFDKYYNNKLMENDIRYVLNNGFVVFDHATDIIIKDIPIIYADNDLFYKQFELWEFLLFEQTNYLVCGLVDQSFKLYCSINSKDLFENRWKTDSIQTSSIVVFEKRFTLLSNWFVTMVLFARTCTKQLFIIRQLIIVLKSLMNYGNLQDAASIISCLTNKKISRLLYLFTKLTCDERLYLKKMEIIFSPLNNFSSYYSYVTNLNPSDKIIPYLYAHLKNCETCWMLRKKSFINYGKSIKSLLCYQEKWIFNKPAHIISDICKNIGYVSVTQCQKRSAYWMKMKIRSLSISASFVETMQMKKRHLLIDSPRKRRSSSRPTIFRTSPKISKKTFNSVIF